MKYASSLTLAVSALALAASGPLASPSAAQDFFAGKTITILVGFGAGGGYDTTTRLVSRHLGNHIPGNPSVVVQNMPGAGSMIVANHIFNVAPKDGTTLGVFASSTALEPLFGNPQAKFDPRKYQWIGSFDREIASCGVWRGAGQDIRTLPDLIAAKKTVVFGSTSPTAITSQHPLFVKNMFNAPIRVIYGFKGTKDVSLAMQRGEVDGSCGMFESSVRGAYSQFVEAGDLKIVVQFGRDRKVEFFGDATQMYSMLKTDEDRQVADIIFRQTELARPLAAPPGTPQDRVATLRAGLAAAMGDDALIADAKKLGITFDPMSGEEAQKLIEDFFNTPPELVKRARAYTQPDN